MNFLALQNEVKNRLEESATPIRWSTQEIKDAINDGYEDIIEFSEAYETEKLITPSLESDGTPYYNLLDWEQDEAFLAIRRIENVDTGRWLQLKTALEMDVQYYARWQTMVGEAQYAMMRGHQTLGIIPIKSTGTLAVKIAAIPIPLLADLDEPIFSAQYHVALAEYAAYELLCRDKNFDAGMVYWNRYTEFRDSLATNKMAARNYGSAHVGVLGGDSYTG